MRRVKVKVHNISAGTLTEHDDGSFTFAYAGGYEGSPVSLTMPVSVKEYSFNTFPPFFDGLLPEGIQLEGLLRTYKIDKNDHLSVLIVTGQDLVGSVTVEEADE